jgi:hypothetical protein
MFIRDKYICYNVDTQGETKMKTRKIKCEGIRRFAYWKNV